MKNTSSYVSLKFMKKSKIFYVVPIYFMFYDFRVVHEKTGRTMEFYSDQPGVQFYTSNFMPDAENNVNFL